MTLACSHAQQLVWQLFNAVEKGFSAAGDTDAAFLAGEGSLLERLAVYSLTTLRGEIEEGTDG